MCRMLVAVNFERPLDMKPLVDDFLAMAQGANEEHEFFEIDKKSIKHKQGWGAAVLDADTSEWRIHTSTKPAYEDSDIHNLKLRKCYAVILHARKALLGVVSPENTHPFAKLTDVGKYVFCHNGLINDKLDYDPEYTKRGETDSESLFYYLLGNIQGKEEDLEDQSIKMKKMSTALNKLTDYTAANIILAVGRRIYIACKFKANQPYYFTMKVGRKKDEVIISSEVLPSFTESHRWHKMLNGEIVKIMQHNGTYTTLLK